MPDSAPQQLLHLVIGGELTDLEARPSRISTRWKSSACSPTTRPPTSAWKAKAQQTVDNAHMRYFIVHLHRLLDPGQDAKPAR